MSRTLLCENCKYDITDEPYVACVTRGKSLAGTHGVCSRCTVPYQRAWCRADRCEGMERLINSYKFSQARAAYKLLADLLDVHLPKITRRNNNCPLPPVGAHMRQRGYDHMLLYYPATCQAAEVPSSAGTYSSDLHKAIWRRRATRITQAKAVFTNRGSP